MLLIAVNNPLNFKVTVKVKIKKEKKRGKKVTMHVTLLTFLSYVLLYKFHSVLSVGVYNLTFFSGVFSRI